MSSLAQEHDCLLVDLDGTVFRGHQPTPGAVETLAVVRSRTLYVTNNASRGPAEVAQHLCAMGFTAKPDDVVTSAQSAARLLREQLEPGAAVLIVGTDSLAAEVQTVGLKPVRQWSDRPAAVVQGHSPHTGWPELAEAALAIRGGALWIAANVDRTLPSERGLLPGNGAMVAALRAATDCVPQVAGKPQPTLMTDALARGTFRTPLVIGDRLDTDIAGACSAGLPSLLVLCGVSTAADTVRAAVGQRPDYIAADLRSLDARADTLRVAPHPAWDVEIGPSAATVQSTGQAPGDSLSVVRALASALWNARRDAGSVTLAAGDDTARRAMARWSLLTSADRLA